MCRFRVACRAAARLHQSTRLLVCLDVFCAAALLKMTEKRQFRAIKGTRDILPPDSALWNWFEQAAREVFEAYNFREIRLPIFEETELFARSIGADTDIVGKEMFTFFDPFTPNELTWNNLVHSLSVKIEPEEDQDLWLARVRKDFAAKPK